MDRFEVQFQMPDGAFAPAVVVADDQWTKIKRDTGCEADPTDHVYMGLYRGWHTYAAPAPDTI